MRHVDGSRWGGMAIVLDAAGACTTLVSTRAAYHHVVAVSSAGFASCSSSRLPGAWKRSSSFRSSAQRLAPKRRFSAGCIVCETKEASTAGVVDDASFKALVMESEMPVLVDFWAPWCGPCRMLDPVIDNIAEKYKGRIKCYKVNTDECSKTATELGIRSIPTCMIFKQGERLDTVIGCVPETTLTAVIDKYIST